MVSPQARQDRPDANDSSPGRQDALLTWRTSMLRVGFRPADLPSPYELRVLAKAEDFATSPLFRKPVFERWRKELAEAWEAAPVMPPDLQIGSAEGDDDAGRPVAGLDPDLGQASSQTAGSEEGTEPGTEDVGGPEVASPDQPEPESGWVDLRSDPPDSAAAAESAGARGIPRGRRSGDPEVGSADEPEALPSPRDFPPCATIYWADQVADALELHDRGGRLELSWKEPENQVDLRTLYRVCTSRETFPIRPEDGEQVVVTGARIDAAMVLSCHDVAVQWIRVWRHQGQDKAAAIAAEPELIGQLAVVAPPRELRVYAAGREVVGRWSVPPEVVDVEVYRLPSGSALPTTVQDQRFRVNVPGLDSFTERDVELGEWEYRAYAIARVSGEARYSPVAVQRVSVNLPLRPVERLEVWRVADGSLRIEWPTVSLGEVSIHVTSTRPEISLQVESLEESALALRDRALARSGALPFPVQQDGDRQWIEGVRLPPGEGGFLSAVVRRGDRAWVGANQFVPALEAITALRLHERVQAQLLTFGLPPLARQVRVYVTAPGAVPDLDTDHPVQTVDAEPFRRSGRIVLSQLSQGRPCSVHVVPVFKFTPLEVGPISSVEYPGLIRLHYRFLPVSEGTDPTGAMRRFRRLQVLNRSPQDVDGQFYVCHNPRRIPLHLNDGVLLTFTGGGPHRATSIAVHLPSERPTDVGVLDVPEGGFLRAFVEPSSFSGSSLPFALLDPPLATLT